MSDHDDEKGHPAQPPGPKFSSRDSGRPSDYLMRDRGPDPGTTVPVIQGPAVEHLKTYANPRASDDGLKLDRDLPERGRLRLEKPEEIAALALAGILLENLRRVGGATVSERHLGQALERLLPLVGRRTMMKLEIEAYDIVDWIGRSYFPGLASTIEPVVEPGIRPITYDPDASTGDLIHRALAEGFDVNMQYYTGGRGELGWRRITPNRIRAEKYLEAFCHTRNADRVFKLSRIAAVEPIGGRAVATRHRPTPKPPQPGLFDEDVE